MTDDGLREKVASIVEGVTGEPGWHDCISPAEAAAAILALPEIAEALRCVGEVDVYRTNCTCNID